LGFIEFLLRAEKGKWADIVIYDKNPLDDINNTKTISAVYVAGNEVKK